ncbi:hypothetical protein NQK81_36840 [Amycolatopsis roodepoortensis]|uniref:hypothetical protein n=1 Tax=Amycolatopsis roodepoortensis TaxID=700274 RepID=UPI00214AEF4B|nr:hypothetical protein [Amycolatopsis roodepoortensis]UUV30286.1 hypothetical protein NQK81_36840 [Amycolatopsis roodepoortensis]
MVESVIAWIGQKVAEKTLDRKSRRHDLSVPGAEATSDLDITVKYTLPYRRSAKAPVRLISQRVDGYPDA